MFTADNVLVTSIGLSIAAIVLVLAGYLLSKFFAGKKLRYAQQRAKELTEQAQRDIEGRKKEAELAAKDMLIKVQQDFERETKERREEIAAIEKRIHQKEENLERRADLVEKKEKDVTARQEALHKNEIVIKEKSERFDALIAEEKQRLQNIASLTPEEAKKILLARLEDEMIHEKAAILRKAEEEVRETADKKARALITAAMQRCASDHTALATISVVNLPSDEMKGRIIGREGRNIRALEMATGVDIIIDDTPEAVTVSGFDMVRREVACIALEHLIADGRIHPGRIEEVVEKAQQEVATRIKEEGERAAFDLDIHGMHPELLTMIGKLKYRTSFGQNVLQHTKEVATLMGIMAAQLGLDAKIARRVGLLHDIGKVAGQEVEGTHALIGANLARKYGESPEVAKAVESHHAEAEVSSVYGVLVCAADAVSAARPGARAETLETYIKRLESLEAIASSFKGVEKSYALQAGREIRIMVQPERIDDDHAVVLARDLRKKIEETMEYPGQIKVVVIRETRAVEYAK